MSDEPGWSRLKLAARIVAPLILIVFLSLGLVWPSDCGTQHLVVGAAAVLAVIVVEIYLL
jgi:hypothetical protein